MSTEIIYVAGRYNKYRRNLSQSPWIDKNDVRVMNSVQEMIEDGVKEYLSFGKSVFASSGREDVDVRMLGRGRPFALKLHGPQNVEKYNNKTFRQIEKFVNDKYRGQVSVRDLQLVSKKDVSVNLSEGQENKRKAYRALCCCSRRLTDEDLERLNNMTDISLCQKTPIRVLHRRTLATRKRIIHSLKLERVKVGDFNSVKLEYLENLVAVDMLTEAGTYIKEFVHGDFGRTQPSLSSLLGNCDTDLMELDVLEIQLDWPPPIDIEMKSYGEILTNSAYQENRSECTDADLAELYLKGSRSMREALKKERGDVKQNLLIEARRFLERANELVESLALFSDNETVEDIATTNLKYLLIPAYLAKIHLSGDISTQRLEAFTRAEYYLQQFLMRMSNYRIGDEQLDRLVRETNGPPQSEGVKTLEDHAQIRRDKIERFNKTRELELRLADLERRLESESDEELVREYNMDLLKKWINDSLEDLDGIVKPALIFERGFNSAELDSPIRAKPTGSSVCKNFVITKDRLQKQVFGTGYPSLPTVSVDEFISKKIIDGDLVFQKDKQIYSNSLQRYAEQPNLLREQEEQSDEEREAKEERDDQNELTRKRRWDEFKDDTPRGSGNRHNMGVNRCATFHCGRFHFLIWYMMLAAGCVLDRCGSARLFSCYAPSE